jgi:dihydropteroate synthase
MAEVGAPGVGTPGVLRLGRGTFGPGEIAVMAIINRTPDSFYDAGATFTDAAALAAVDRAVAQGADLVDVGGVPAGEGPEVTAAEELRRVVGFITVVRDRYPELVISVDTWRAEVAAAACAAGADLVNDTWSGHDPDLAGVAAAYGAGLVCSHVGAMGVRAAPRRPVYTDVVAEVIDRTTRLAQNAVRQGVRADGILIDPTHDFGKNTHHSLELTRRVDELVATGWPVLVALSNKDFVGETLDRPKDQRLFGTLAATAWCAAAGVRMVRAHEVRATRDVVDMIATLSGDRRPLRVRRGLE